MEENIQECLAHLQIRLALARKAEAFEKVAEIEAEIVDIEESAIAYADEAETAAEWRKTTKAKSKSHPIIEFLNEEKDAADWDR